MSDYVLMTDSSCDLPAAMADELSLIVAPLTVLINGKSYKNRLDESEISFKEFYTMLRQKVAAKTSAVNVGEFIELMEPVLQAGRDILYLGFSSGISGTYAAGEMAAKDMREKYPERKILTVDTLCASMGEGLIVYLAAKRKALGESIEQVRDYVEQTKLHVAHWFTVDDLFHLMRGGRVAATSAIVGTLLSIKPVLHVDNAGKLINMEKARGRKASLSRMVEIAKAHAQPALKDQTVFISHCDCEEDAQRVADLIRREGTQEVVVNSIGPVVGTHSGPGTVALFYLADQR